MNVRELKEMLNKYPDNMEILTTFASDYTDVEESDWGIVKAVEKDEWYMRSHPTMSAENKAKEKEYLHIRGN